VEAEIQALRFRSKPGASDSSLPRSPRARRSSETLVLFVLLVF